MQGNCDDRFTAVREALARNLDGDELGASRHRPGRDRRRPVGRLPGPGADDALDPGHDRQRLVDDEVRALPRGADAGRARNSTSTRRSATTGRSSRPGRRTSRCGTSASHTSGVSAWEQPLLDQGHVRLGDRHRAARRAAAVVEPGRRRATTRRTRGTWSVRSSGGSPTRRSRRSSPRDRGPLGADFQVGAREADWDRIAPVVAAAAPEANPDADMTSVAMCIGPVR